MAVRAIPEGYHSVTPYLIVDGADKLIDFMSDAFGAKERMRMPGPGGVVGHAEMQLGDSVVMLADSASVDNNRSATGMIHLYVEDVDAVYKDALAAGAAAEREPTTMFYGDRGGAVRDQFGNTWWISTHVEDVPPDEMQKRSEEWMKQQGQA